VARKPTIELGGYDKDVVPNYLGMLNDPFLEVLSFP
jgi:hypothetical protein